MEELLAQLEARLKKLMDKNNLLEAKHKELEQNQQHLAQEKKLLQERQQGAIAQIESMIARLKPLELEEQA